MSTLKAYEVHTRERGKWRIDAIFDDKNLALDHAKRLIGGPVDSARVIEETMDTESGETGTKVVFRDGTAPLRQAPAPAAAPAGAAAVAVAGAAGTAAPEGLHRRRVDPVTRYGLCLAGIGSCCVALLFGLAYMLDSTH